MKPDDLVPVQIGNGRVVMHTWSEWLRLIKGVDLEAARKAPSSVPLEDEDPRSNAEGEDP